MDVPLKVRQRVCRDARDRHGVEWTPDQVSATWARFVRRVVPVVRELGGNYADCPDDPAAFREWALARPCLCRLLKGMVRHERVETDRTDRTDPADADGIPF